jgi:hypothetical protein
MSLNRKSEKRLRFGGLVAALALALGLAGCGAGASPAPESPAGDGNPSAPAGELKADFDQGGDIAPSSPEPAAEAEASGAPPSATSRSEGAAQKESPEDRPGLGTVWGETRESRITTVSFERADPSTPFSTASLFYNDAQGANAMASASGFKRFSGGQVRADGGVVSIGLKGGDGRFLSGFTAGGRNYVIGEAGDRYSIVVRNHAPDRVECVVSVDGLDVLDGKPASFRKRGYLIDGHGQVEVEGFRTSTDAVAAFRFGSVRGSYASQKHGDSRNVGVIGVAVFHERGTNPNGWTRDEINRRHDANPFPGQFATPP